MKLYFNNYIVELRVKDDVIYLIDFIEDNLNRFYTFRGISDPMGGEVGKEFKLSLKLAREKAEALKPDSGIAVITKSGLTLICGSGEEREFFKSFYTSRSTEHYYIYHSLNDFLGRGTAEMSCSVGRIGGMLYYLNDEGKIIDDATFNKYKEELHKYDHRWYGTNSRKIKGYNIGDMRIKKQLCISYALYHGISLDELVDIFNYDDFDRLVEEDKRHEIRFI